MKYKVEHYVEEEGTGQYTLVRIIYYGLGVIIILGGIEIMREIVSQANLVLNEIVYILMVIFMSILWFRKIDEKIVEENYLELVVKHRILEVK